MSVKRSLLFLMLILSAGRLVGQFKNVMLDEQRNDNDYVCEPAIVINPQDPLNMVAGSVLNNVYFTKNGGESWQKGKLSSPFGVSGNPALIADSKGNFFYFHLSDPTGGEGGYSSEKSDCIVVQKSEDGGETWSPGESIGLNRPKDQDKEWPAVDTKGNLFVAWTQYDKYGDPDPECFSNILFSMSKNGKKWSDPIRISQLPGNCLNEDSTTRGAVPAATLDGKVFVAWSSQGKIFLDRSFDGGDMWLTNDILITEQNGGWDLTIPGHDHSNGMPVLMTDKSKSPYRNSLYVVWADQRSGENDTDIWFTRSHNYGDHWSTPQRINNDSTTTHQYLPWMTVDHETGYIYIVYYDRRSYDNNQTDVYLAYSTDGGAAFENVLISEKPFTPLEDKFFGDYINISAHEGIIAPIWTRMEEGKTSVWTSVIRHEDLVNVPTTSSDKVSSE